MSGALLDSFWLRFLPQPVRSRLAGRRLLQTLIANAGWLVADKLVRLGVGLFVGVWVARYLAPARFGTLNYVQALVALIAALSTMGLPDINVRDFVRHGERAHEIAATSILLRLVGAGLSLLVAIAAILVARPGDSEVLAMTVIVAASLLPQSLDVIDQFYQSQNKVREIVLLRNGAFVLTSVAKVVAIVADAPLIVFAAIYTLEFALVGLAFVVFAARHGNAFRLRHATLIESQRLTAEAWPLLIRQLAIGVYMRVDQILLGRLLDDHAVGIYAAAARISEIWYFVPTAIMTAFVPRLAARHAESPAIYQVELAKVMRVIAAVSVAAAAAMSFGAGPIVAALYGPPYAEAARVLAVHAWSGLPVGIGVASSAWFINHGLMRFGLYQALAGATLSVVLNLALIPRLGAVGAAWAAILSYSISAILMNALFKDTRPIFALQLQALKLR